MRKSVLDQLPLVPLVAGHPHMEELAEMSQTLDAHPEASERVLADLVAGGIDPKKGAEGMSGEQVLRALIIKQAHMYSYEELAFHLADSMSFRAFCRVGFKSPPSSSTLQDNLKKVRAETIESINRMLLHEAKELDIEDGQKTRSDCTVMESNIHEPSDSELLWDCVRVLTRQYLKRLGDYGVSIPFSDHTRRAKKRFVGIKDAKKKDDRERRYRDLIEVTEWTVVYAKQAAEALEKQFAPDALLQVKFYEELRQYIERAEHVLDQTRRRVLHGESVPAAEKIVSIFEPHTDIIVKDRRETLYGHKICLTAGASGLVLDCVILSGNPADSTLAVEAMKRQVEIYGNPPRKAAFDGGFSSKDNLEGIKALGVEDVAFSKAPGIQVSDMVKSTWVYRQLRRFRAGVESIISFLKRSFGWTRCTWRSLKSFKAYAWSSVLAANLLVMARHAIARR